MATISVNGVEVTAREIAAEAQNHPAESPDAAWQAAAEALVVRQLLLQEAQHRGISPEPQAGEDGCPESDREALTRQLLEREIRVPEADAETCRRYYDNNRHRFRSPDIHEAAHILFAAVPSDAAAYAKAVASAEAAIRTVTDDPSAFEVLARDLSACPSARQGGRLGQVTRGQTVPEFETFLFNLAEGQVCPIPVKTRFGAHVVRLDRRIEGRDLPFEMVRQWIADYLAEASWRRAVAQYISILAGRADITGIALRSARSPLVQ